jgi:hypothetical protein
MNMTKARAEEGVTYMPVPKCRTCLHWDNIGHVNQFHGDCRLPDHDAYSLAVFAAMTTHADFGCVSWRGHPEKT